MTHDTTNVGMYDVQVRCCTRWVLPDQWLQGVPMTQTLGSFSISSSTASRKASHMSLPFLSLAAVTCELPLLVLPAQCIVFLVKQW